MSLAVIAVYHKPPFKIGDHLAISAIWDSPPISSPASQSKNETQSSCSLRQQPGREKTPFIGLYQLLGLFDFCEEVKA
jgi:hypothetical protein